MADQDNFNDLRQLKRRHLIYYLEVFDNSTDEFLGHLVDLTVEGMKLVSKNYIEPQKDYALKMVLPEGHTPDREVHFSAKSMWCREDVNPDFYAVGLSAPNLDKDTRKIFTILINQIGFND